MTNITIIVEAPGSLDVAQAVTSAAEALASEQAAAADALAASNSEDAAAISAGAAAASALAASGSASAAAESAATAQEIADAFGGVENLQDIADAAAASASAAAASETQAGVYAVAAAGSETNAATYATAASVSAASAAASVAEAEQVITDFELLLPATPQDYGAVGDGVTNDAAAFSTITAEYVFTPDNIFDIGTLKYTGLVYGPGAVRMTGAIASADSEGNFVGFDPAGSNIYATPNIWAETANGETASPGDIPKYFNVALAPGSNIRTTSGSAWRSTLLGSAVGERIVDWERVEAIGNGAMRFARLANRVTAIGTIALQWLGANSQQFLRDTYHDFWNGVDKPGDAGWDFMGMETRNPGIGTWLHSYATYPTDREDCSSLVAIGRDAALHTIKDQDSVYVGYQCGTNTFDALQNTAVGSRALRDGVRAQRNTAVGRSAGFILQQGVGNVYLGNVAGFNHVLGDNCIFIGNSAGDSLASTSSNSFVVQMGPATTPLMVGSGDSGKMSLGLPNLDGLSELPGRGWMVNARVGETAGTFRLKLETNVIESGVSYGQYDWSGNDNQGAGVRGYMRGVAVGSLGAMDIEFATQPPSTPGDTPTPLLRMRNNGAVRFLPRATAPSSALEGDMYYDSVTKKFRGYNGTTWTDLN